jgi:hypothetical protein
MIQPSAPVPNPYGPAPTPEAGGKAIWSLCLGLFGLIAWFLPILGLPTTITGLVFGIKSIGPRKGMATAGIVLCVIGLVLSIANAAIGA